MSIPKYIICNSSTSYDMICNSSTSYNITCKPINITLWSGHAIYSNPVLTWLKNIKPVCLPVYSRVQTGSSLICVPLSLCRGFCPTSRPSQTWGASTRCGCSWWWGGWCSSWALPAASALCGRTPSCSSLYVGSLQVSPRHVVTYVTRL